MSHQQLSVTGGLKKFDSHLAFEHIVFNQLSIQAGDENP